MAPRRPHDLLPKSPVGAARVALVVGLVALLAAPFGPLSLAEPLIAAVFGRPGRFIPIADLPFLVALGLVVLGWMRSTGPSAVRYVPPELRPRRRRARPGGPAGRPAPRPVDPFDPDPDVESADPAGMGPDDERAPGAADEPADDPLAPLRDRLGRTRDSLFARREGPHPPSRDDAPAPDAPRRGTRHPGLPTGEDDR